MRRACGRRRCRSSPACNTCTAMGGGFRPITCTTAGSTISIGTPSSIPDPPGESAMELIADRGRRVAIEELNTSRLLAHARKQAQQRHLDDVLIVDVDAHHYENECLDEFLPFM